MEPKVLYNSEAIKRCIRKLFDGAPHSKRRIVLVAYIGRDYAKFLPDPQGIEIVCSPTAGATSAAAVSELRDAGAAVKFSDKLHMKVYWSANRGCLITSANLSNNALERGRLKEAGVLIDAESVDIDQLLKEARPYAVTDANLESLKNREDKIKRAMASVGMREPHNRFQYLDWYQSKVSTRSEWKLGYWFEQCDSSNAARKISNTRYGPTDWINVGKTQASDRDWLLTFKVDAQKQIVDDDLTWLYVDHIVPIGNNESMYEKDCPFQAIQVFPSSKCPHPPFALTGKFVKVFKTTIAKHWGASLESESLIPSRQLLDDIARSMRPKAKRR
jgi:hypothetical protein